MKDGNAHKFAEKKDSSLSSFPLSLSISSLFSSREEFDYYVSNYSKTGFEGALNLYRTRLLNFEDEKVFLNTPDKEENEKGKEVNEKRDGRRIYHPVLMVTAPSDNVLRPEFTYGMEDKCPTMVKASVDGGNHWLLQEFPEKCFDILQQWLLMQMDRSKL